MDIERLQIEGGFLDGFDVKFSSGLNVLIGARGTGKTSVIELIRFATGARNHTADAEKRSTDHIRSVLGSGEVSVQVGDVIDTIVATRNLEDDAPRADQSIPKPLIFSQTEIETLGLSEGGRLRLIDSFVSKNVTLANAEAAAVSAIRSVFKEISAIEAERKQFTESSSDVSELNIRIAALEATQRAQQADSVELGEKQKVLTTVSTQLAQLAVQEETLGRFAAKSTSWSDDLDELIQGDFGAESWDSGQGADPLMALREEYIQLVAVVENTASSFLQLAEKVAVKRALLLGKRTELETNARALRSEIDRSVAGAGELSRQLSQLRTDAAQRLSRQKLVEERDRRLVQLRERRDARIADLDKVRSSRHDQRSIVAKQLNDALKPQVKVVVERFGQYAEYAKALTEALRGSGMRYNDIVDTVTKSVSPQELLEFMDSNNFDDLAKLANLPRDRAARLIAQLRDVGGVELVTANIEDNVRLALLDGADYKEVSALSAGQRCTVVLSIILQHKSRTLVIDQPEDHLDNAYIANTIIKAIRSRKAHGQVIISTHNANIPVLGDADLVIEMTSDGRNGFVQVCEKLGHSKAVEAITNVMEGGAQAFSDRATFYESHQL